jgi:hypothetical protein
MCSISIFIVAFSLLNLSVRVYANQPIVRFKNRTVGILTDVDAGVFTATENVTILGDLEVKATNKTANIIEEVDSLIRLQSNVELRVNTFAQHANMGIVCNPEGTEYRKRNFETGEFGECVCKEGYTGEFCLLILLTDTPIWTLVFRHDSSEGDYFSNTNMWAEAKRTNPTIRNATKFSILDEVEQIGLINERYTFKLVYPEFEEGANTNIWSQASNPVTSGARVEGYKAIGIQHASSQDGQPFLGLHSEGAYGPTFLDGNPNGGWWFAVGARRSHGGSTSVPGFAIPTRITELYICIANCLILSP